MGYPVRTETVRANRPGGRGQQSGALGVGQGIYEASDTPLHRVGEKLELFGGRIFRYAHFYADTTDTTLGGYLMAPDISEQDRAEIDSLIVDVASDSGNYSPAAGATKIEFTLASVDKNEFQGGTMHITDGEGEGHTYLIKRNSASGEKLDSDDPALDGTSSVILELYDGVVVALDTDSEFVIIGNMWKNLTPADSTDTNVSGVAMIGMDVSVKEYAWVQTWGPGTVIVYEAVTEGDMLAVYGTTAGQAKIRNDHVYPDIGYCLQDQSTGGGQCAVFLQIAP